MMIMVDFAIEKERRVMRIRGFMGIVGVLALMAIAAISCRERSQQQATMVMDSNDLKQTVVAMTLEDPIPKGKNVIWCGSFQIAWNELKRSVGEPPLIAGAQELADRLNRAKVSSDEIEKRSFYAMSGRVSDGVIERIQAEQARRFPRVPKPVLGRDSASSPDALVVYAYLDLDIILGRPFQTLPHPLTDPRVHPLSFRQSNGEESPVECFGALCEMTGIDLSPVWDQVDILYFKRGTRGDRDQFIVDLCRETTPYQVVLASIPEGINLGETLAFAEQKNSEFRQNPNYADERKLRHFGIPDILVVPDLAFTLNHCFRELTGRTLGNAKMVGVPIQGAAQIVNFTLSRTGPTQKASAIMSQARVSGPRRFVFDRPFLIYVKKRSGGQPFFVMWVDNAELMRKWDGSGEAQTRN